MSDAGTAPAAVARLGLLQLVAVKGASVGERFEAVVPGQPITIGRKSTNDLVLKDDTVSREHAIIEPTPDGWRITARKREALLMRAGRVVTEEGELLADGDELQLGLAVIQVTIAPLADQDDADRTVVFDPDAAPVAPPPRPAASPPGDANAKPPDAHVMLVAAEPRVPAPPPAPRAPDVREEPVRAPARRDRPPQRPRERIGHFDVLATLHDADACRLERAVDTRSGEAVTLRRLQGLQLGFFARRRFTRAADGLRAIAHGNVLAPRAVERADAELLMVYPPVNGVGASVVLRQGRRDLPIDLAVWIAREAARGLAHVERVAGSDLRVVVGDGEVVCGRDGDVVLLLAPPVPAAPDGDRYGAPEEHAGGAGGMRAAIFSLGVLLWELLAREPVLPGQQTTLRSVDAVRIEVPPALAVATMRALELRPDDRFAHADELAEALDDALERLAPGYGSEAAARWLREHVPDEEGDAW